MTDAGWAGRKDVKATGFYWLIWAGKDPQIVQVRGTSVHFTSGLTMSLEEVDGQFLGTLSPDDRQHGYQEGLKAAGPLLAKVCEWYEGGTLENILDEFYAQLEQQAQATALQRGRGKGGVK